MKRRFAAVICTALFAITGCGTPATQNQGVVSGGQTAATFAPAASSSGPATAAAATQIASRAPTSAAPTDASVTQAPVTQTPATRAPTTAAPTAKPVGVVFTSVRSPVSRNATGLAAVSTAPNVACTIVVTYKSGPSSAQGLTAKTSDTSGAVSWTWNIGSNTTSGTWPIDVTCGGAIGHATFVVQ